MGEKFMCYCIVLNCLFRAVILSSSCDKHLTCHECITDPNICVWCASDEFKGIRCKPASTQEEEWCPYDMQNPISDSWSIKDNEFSSNIGSIIQIRPQKYKFNLRPGQPVNFEFSFKGAQNYPVDLYFLLDASSSMEKVKKSASSQAENIYQMMSSITKDVYLGMGTFIDKNAIPYVKIKNSETTYSFRNQLKLTSQFKEFKKKVDEAPFGKNFDKPEGGLDALAQVMTCKDEIGWRNESRKIVVFLTNGPYHVAGDGKWAGIVQPYDGKCYTVNGVYTNEITMDYPSVSILSKLAADSEITVIFAVDSTVYDIYAKLINTLGRSKCTTYNTTSESVVTILKNIYEEISRTIILNVNMKSKHRKYFDITFNPDCKSKVENGNKNCTVSMEEEKRFNGTIELLNYYNVNNVLIDIVPVGINEKLTLDINIINECGCEKTAAPDSKLCNGGGALQCGICKCNENRYGDRCACTLTKDTNSSDIMTCIADGSKEECSGHGSCFCGTCQCRERFEGQFCECNKDSCPRDSTGAVCTRHGVCDCGVCKCDPEWSGEACDCLISTISCIDDDGKTCNNRGECICGTCKCQATARWDARYHQDHLCRISACHDCHYRQCRVLEHCAICLHQGTHSCSDICDIDIKTNVTDIFSLDEKSTWNVCSNIRVAFGCYTHFFYRYDEVNYNIELLVQTERDCLESYYVFGGISLATLILVGITTIVAWKIITDARDRREYRRFVKEHAEDISEHCPNPIFMPAQTTFHNPIFRKRSIY